MKKTAIILALIVLGLLIAGCAKDGVTAGEPTVDDVERDLQEITDTLDSDLAELDALDQELAEIEAMDLG
ncbi:hypothetical protein JW851_04965 [Candidatus Woesearchaeota archaeon]|nr:hypothetical protein [Candidatus Woesearchaeota archaeon]